MRLFAPIAAAIISVTVPLDANDAGQRPNILFCIADDASQPHFGAYGCTWVKTPAFDRVAREGILFNNAWTPNAKCAPSRACILTGRNPWQLEQAFNHMPYFPAKFKTYPEALSENGYFVGKTAKGWAPGVAIDADGKRRELAGKAYNRKKLKPPTRAISSIDYAGNFAEFLDAKPSGQPFCFWYGGLEPHRRFEFGSGVAKGGKLLGDIPHVPPFWPDNNAVRNDMLDYAFEIEYFDLHLGKMLDTLEDRGLIDNTIVVVTSDNGMPFPRIKGQKYKLSNQMPLAIMWPKGIKSPSRYIDDFVNFIDFAPTFLELANLDAQKAGMQPTTGRSLMEYFQTKKSGIINKSRDHILLGKERHDVGRPNDWGYPVRGIVTNRYLYLKNFEPTRWPGGNPETGYLNCDGSPTKTEILNLRRESIDTYFWRQAFGMRPSEELYDIESDPECVTNLATDNTLAAAKSRLAEQMNKRLKSQGDPRLHGKPDQFDNYKVATTPIANYHARFLKGDKARAGWVNDSDYETRPIVDEFAAAQLRAFRADQPLMQLSARFKEATLADGYRIQRRFVAGRLANDAIAGFKGAVAGAAGQQALGIGKPLSAVLFDSGKLSAAQKVAVDRKAFPGTAIETEIGFIIGRSIAEPIASVEQLKQAVSAVVAVVELPAGKREQYRPMTPADIAAINVGSENFIVGPAKEVAEIDPDRVAIKLTAGTQILNEAKGSDAKDDQWANLLIQVNHAVAHGYQINEGQLVITGALGKIIRDPQAGQYVADFGNLGRIEFELR